MRLLTEKFIEQQPCWPESGRHIMAQYDDSTIVVYQAYRPSIAEYAVSHGRFGQDFSFNRMSWIKPNFLWMMYRCGWASKSGQERVLAIRMEQAGFDAICEQAVPSSFYPERYTARSVWQAAVAESDVRSQWDPDHDPRGEPVDRRAVQLGLRGAVLRKYSDEWIREVIDITEFVHKQKTILDQKGVGDLLIPVERVYPASANIGADII